MAGFSDDAFEADIDARTIPNGVFTLSALSTTVDALQFDDNAHELVWNLVGRLEDVALAYVPLVSARGDVPERHKVTGDLKLALVTTQDLSTQSTLPLTIQDGPLHPARADETRRSRSTANRRAPTAATSKTFTVQSDQPSGYYATIARRSRRSIPTS